MPPFSIKPSQNFTQSFSVQLQLTTELKRPIAKYLTLSDLLHLILAGSQASCVRVQADSQISIAQLQAIIWQGGCVRDLLPIKVHLRPLQLPQQSPFF